MLKLSTIELFTSRMSSPRAVFFLSKGTIYYKFWGQGTWSNWSYWAPSEECMKRVEEYMQDITEVEKDLVGQSIILKLLAESFTQCMEK